MFRQTLYYQDANINHTNTPCYNGDISAMEWVDELSLTYRGNQLLKVDDAAINPTLSMSLDFKDGARQEIEYDYDANGNQVKDLNKGISKIEYNVLNLPKKVTFTGVNNPTTTYAYSADGDKLNVIHKSSIEKRTDYVDAMIYENGSLKRILVDGGYIENGIYHFFLQDHQGNNRIVAKADGAAIQSNHYYPYGMPFAESTYTDKQPYKYNGKELDIEYGLNLYDYEARYTDAVLGRFTTPDPLSEKYYGISLYAYCLGNSINFWDPDGKAPQDPPIGVGFHNWSHKKQIRVANVIQSTNAAENRIFKGTGISVSASAWSVGGDIGVASVKGKLSLNVANVTAKTDGMSVSTTASLGEATGEISVGSASTKAGITIAKAKANVAKNDAGLSFDVISSDAKVQVGSNLSTKLDDQDRISTGVKVGPAKVNASFSLQATGEWFGGVVKLISELLSPEIRIDTRRNQNYH